MQKMEHPEAISDYVYLEPVVVRSYKGGVGMERPAY